MSKFPIFIDKSGKTHYASSKSVKKSDLEEVFHAAMDLKKSVEILMKPEGWPSPVWERYNRLRHALGIVFQSQLKKKGLL